MPTPLQNLRRHPVMSVLRHTTVTLLLLTVGYFMLPFREPWDEPLPFLQLGLSLVVTVVLFVLLRRRVRATMRLTDPHYAQVEWLLAALYVIILSFAMLYAVIAAVAPEQFVGIADRMDALYFSVTLMATVGFGDITAQGTFARALVTVHMVFNLVYLGTGIRLLTSNPGLPTPPGPGGP